jgi:hypothetical protein
MTRYRNTAIICAAVILALIVGVATGHCATTTKTLEWDANTEPDLAGYKLYQALGVGPFVVVQTLGKVTTTTVVVADGAWFYKLTAFDTFGNESGFSNTATFQADTQAPGAPQGLRVVTP